MGFEVSSFCSILPNRLKNNHTQNTRQRVTQTIDKRKRYLKRKQKVKKVHRATVAASDELSAVVVVVLGVRLLRARGRRVRMCARRRRCMVMARPAAAGSIALWHGRWGVHGVHWCSCAMDGCSARSWGGARQGDRAAALLLVLVRHEAV